MGIFSDRVREVLLECSKYNARLCIATKMQKIEDIAEANISSDIILAENRVQEAEEKYFSSASLGGRNKGRIFPKNELHFIGRLQSNKVRKAVKIFDVIESVDSLELMEKINKIAKEERKIQRIFLNINISEDIAKSGFLLKTFPFFQVENISNEKYFSHISGEGLFTILKAGLSDEEKRYYYKKMKILFEELKPHFGEKFTEISMGMSDDYHISLEEGASIIRVGSGIFG